MQVVDYNALIFRDHLVCWSFSLLGSHDRLTD